MSPRSMRLACLGLLFMASCSRLSDVLTLKPDQTPDAAGQPPDAAPDAAPPGTLTSSSLDSGVGHSCATLHGVLYCWGDNSRGQLGLGDTTSRNQPTRVGVRGDWARVAAGANHSCALRSDGTAFCFGADDIGQLGQAGLGQSLVPLSVALPTPATSIVTESNHVCVIVADAALICWGENIEGQIGQGDGPPIVSQFAPVPVGTDHDWIAVDTGQGHSCGLRGPGDLYCWGRNTSSQLGLGDGAPEQTRTPTRVGSASYSRIHAGQNHSCGIRTDGSLECWGDNQFGNLGTGDRVTHRLPTRIGDQQDWLEISLDTFHSCAIDVNSHLFCWGRNVEGQLGVGDTDDRLSPTLIPGEGFAQVAVGRFHTCALKSDDSVWCAGANDSGQLGLADTERRNAFTELAFP